jgi:hypothetical protein
MRPARIVARVPPAVGNATAPNGRRARIAEPEPRQYGPLRHRLLPQPTGVYVADRYVRANEAVSVTGIEVL